MQSSFYQQSFYVSFFNWFFSQPDGTDLFHFVHGHQTWNGYLAHMEQDGTWGDHVILCAAANYFKTFIHVVSSLSHSNDVIITPYCPVDKSKPLVLGHIHEVHYVSLQPVQGTAHYITPIYCYFCFIMILVRILNLHCKTKLTTVTLVVLWFPHFHYVMLHRWLPLQ